MKQFILLLHEDPAGLRDTSPSDMQAIVARYTAWAEKLGAAGRLEGGHKLRDEGGKRLRKQAGRLQVTDGPYAEVKDMIGGLFVVTAENYADAASLVSDCPHLDIGWIELREVEPT
jgi:hypothetical protein